MRNVLGARVLSLSGRQMFMIDRFRKTGRPVIEVLADPDSIFMHGLRSFRRRTIYANIVNEIDTVFYTTAISKADPFEHLHKINLQYIKGYEPVVVDWAKPFEPSTVTRHETSFLASIDVKRAMLYVATAILSLLLMIPFLIMQAYLSILSTRRILLHKKGKTDIKVTNYRIPLLVDGMQRQADHMYQTLSSALPTQHLQESVASNQSPASSMIEGTSSKPEVEGMTHTDEISKDMNGSTEKYTGETPMKTADEHREDTTDNVKYASVLALTPAQFKMIKNLDELGLRKFPVHIHNTLESHAAIIVRFNRPELYEGQVVVKHWLREEFLK